MRLLVDLDRRPVGRLAGRLQAVGDHGRDELAVVGDPVALEHQQLVVGDVGQPRRVAGPSTASTPGIASTAAVSTERTVPRATGDCTGQTYARPAAGYSTA